MLRKGRQDKGHRLEATAFLRTIRANQAFAYCVAAVLGARNAGIRSARTKRGARIEKDTASSHSKDRWP